MIAPKRFEPFVIVVPVNRDSFIMRFSVAAVSLGPGLFPGGHIAWRLADDGRSFEIRSMNGWNTGATLFQSRPPSRQIKCTANRFAEHFTIGKRYPVRYDEARAALVVNLKD